MSGLDEGGVRCRSCLEPIRSDGCGCPGSGVPVARPEFALVSSFAEWSATSTVSDAPPMPWRWGGYHSPDDPSFRPDRVTAVFRYRLDRPDPRWRVFRVQVTGVLVSDPSRRVEMCWGGDPYVPEAWRAGAPAWLVEHVEWVSRLGPGVSW